MTEKFYTKTWFVILLCIVFFPAGIYLLWKYKKFNKPVRIGITSVVLFIAVVRMFTYKPMTSTTPEVPKQTDISQKTEPIKEVKKEDPIETKIVEFINSNSNLNMGNFKSNEKIDNWKSGERYNVRTSSGSYQFYFNGNNEVVGVYDINNERKKIFSRD